MLLLPQYFYTMYSPIFRTFILPIYLSGEQNMKQNTLNTTFKKVIKF